MNKRVRELLFQTLENELCGTLIYSKALDCVLNEELAQEWKAELDQSGRHLEVLYELFESVGLDTEEETPGRLVIRHLGESLLGAMEMARISDEQSAAELFASDCIVLVETKNHSNWFLLEEIARRNSGKEAAAIRRACAQVEGEGDASLYQNTGWSRELWISALGLPAILPPPEVGKRSDILSRAARAAKVSDLLDTAGVLES